MKRERKPRRRVENRWPGARLKALRHRLGLTQTDAANAVGVTLRAWQYWEQGIRSPGIQSQLLLDLLDQKKHRK